MEVDKIKICRLCFEICKSDFEVIEDTTKEIINFLLLQLDLDISNEPVICSSCAENLKECFNFKIDYLHRRSDISNKSENVELNVPNIHLDGNVADASETFIGNDVCCSCMELINQETSILIRNGEKGMTTILEEHFPEMVSNGTMKYMCTSCYESLQSKLTFISNCMAVEAKIQEYCKGEGTNSKSQVELSNVLLFIPKNQLPSNINSSLIWVNMEENFEEIDDEDKTEIKKEEDLIEMEEPCTIDPMKKKRKVEKEGGKKKSIITMEVKKEIIEKHNQGMRVANIARFYNKSTSTICTILKKKREIMGLNVAKGVSRMSKQRPRVLEDVEKLLLEWINEKQLAGNTVTENLICEKAKVFYADLVGKLPGTSTEHEEGFKASRGWFDNFKRRSGIYTVVRHGEAASSDAITSEAFSDEFQKLIISECYLPQQVFNCDETGLFWKKMPKRTYITIEEKATPGHKPMKDRLSLLLCANASGDFKVKPLLVYHSENPQAFKKCKVQKSQLNVMWRSNSKALVTPIFFVEWINEIFGPAVKKYLLEKNLPLKVLLVMDNAPAHPPGIEDDFLEEMEFIKIKFLPPNSTPLLQPMDQQIVSNFKKLYTKALFQRCFEVTEGTNLTLREFWKNHFHIVNCLSIIDKAWTGVTRKTLNSAWKKLWPDCALPCDFEGPVHEQELPVVDEIVSLGKTMGLKVNKNDIQELVEAHNQELTADELIDLHREQQQEVMEGISSEEEEDNRESLSSDRIKEMCKMWETVKNFVENHHPNKAAAMRAMNLFNDNAMLHFHQILKRRQKQVSLDRLLVKVTQKENNSDEPPDSSDFINDNENRPTSQTIHNVHGTSV